MGRWKLRRTDRAQIFVQMDEIVGKGRPRFTKSGAVYTPAKTEAVESLIKAAWLKKHGTLFSKFNDEVRLDIAYDRPLSKSNPKYWAGRADLGKPDIDNVVKLVMDALSGVAYRDDKCITQIVCRKLTRSPYLMYGKTAKANMRIVINYYREEYEEC